MISEWLITIDTNNAARLPLFYIIQKDTNTLIYDNNGKIQKNNYIDHILI